MVDVRLEGARQARSDALEGAFLGRDGAFEEAASRWPELDARSWEAFSDAYWHAYPHIGEVVEPLGWRDEERLVQGYLDRVGCDH